VKIFNEEAFRAADLATRFAEEYYSVSRRRVLRGLHFQVPPHEHTKVVYCTDGDVLDVVLDLRAGSPTFGLHHLFRLSARRRNMVYIPAGLAHGFYVTSAGRPWSTGPPAPIPRITTAACAGQRRHRLADRIHRVGSRSFPPALRDFQSPFRDDAS